MTWVHDGGRGGYLCDGCRTIVCSGIRDNTPLDDAIEVRRFAAVVGKPCGRLFCKPKCAAERGLSANEYEPAFSALRLSCGQVLNDATGYDAVVLGHGARATRNGGLLASWFSVVWHYRPRDLLRSCVRVRDDADFQVVLDVARRLGGLEATRPLLDEFFGRAP